MFKTKLYEDGAKGRGSIDLPDGKYLFEIMSAEIRTAGTGRSQVNLRLKSVEGPVLEQTGWDTWNLLKPDDSTKAKEVMGGFWVDAKTAWPDIYDESKGVLYEDKLVGRRFHGTLFHEANLKGEMRPKIKGHKFVVAAGTAPAGAPSGAPESSKPERFASP